MKKTLITILLILTTISNVLPTTLVGEYRNPLTLISWDTGVVLDEDGNGIQTTPYTDSYYNYINYEGMEPGAEVFTLFVYNPLTLWGDDTIGRFDFKKKGGDL